MQGRGKKKESPEAALGLTAFLRRDRVYLMAYTFATVRRDEHPGETWFDTVQGFKRRFGIPDELVSDECLIREIRRMTVDFINEGL